MTITYTTTAGMTAINLGVPGPHRLREDFLRLFDRIDLSGAAA